MLSFAIAINHIQFGDRFIFTIFRNVIFEFCWIFWTQIATINCSHHGILSIFVQKNKNGNISFRNISLNDLCMFFISLYSFVAKWKKETSISKANNHTILIIILNILWHPINCKHSNANKIAGLNYDCKFFVCAQLLLSMVAELMVVARGRGKEMINKQNPIFTWAFYVWMYTLDTHLNDISN